jgi:thiamine-phosphate pyrophosphorylase
MELFVITPEHNTNNELEQVNAMLSQGLKRLHIRKPLFDTAMYAQYISGIEKQYHANLIIHGGFELCLEFMLGGIHLNSEKRNAGMRTGLVDKLPNVSFSTSFHSWDEVIKEGADYEHVFISPVNDSISKPGYKGCIALGGIADVRTHFNNSGLRCPAIVGLGGVQKDNMKHLMGYGFNGAAVLGAIWQSVDPVASFCELMAAIRTGD